MPGSRASEIFGKGSEQCPPVTGHVQGDEEQEQGGEKGFEVASLGFVVGQYTLKRGFPDGDDVGQYRFSKGVVNFGEIYGLIGFLSRDACFLPVKYLKVRRCQYSVVLALFQVDLLSFSLCGGSENLGLY